MDQTTSDKAGSLSGWNRSLTNPTDANVKKTANDSLNSEDRGSDRQNLRLSRFTLLGRFYEITGDFPAIVLLFHQNYRLDRWSGIK